MDFMRFNILSNKSIHTQNQNTCESLTNECQIRYQPPNEYIGMQLNDMEYAHDMNNNDEHTNTHNLQNNYNNMNDDITLKIILLGDAHTGKSTFVRRIENKHHITITTTYISTIGVDMTKIKLINTKLNKQIGVHIWDTAGQERFRSIISTYYKNTCLALIFFDINNYESFQNAKTQWFEQVKENAPNTMIFLVGNKYDTRDQTRSVLDEEIHSFVIKNRLFYIENENKSREMAKINLKAIVAEVLKRKDLNPLDGITYPKRRYEDDESLHLLDNHNSYIPQDNCCIIS